MPLSITSKSGVAVALFPILIPVLDEVGPAVNSIPPVPAIIFVVVVPVVFPILIVF